MKKILCTFIALMAIVINTNAYDFEKFSVSGGAELVANYNFRGVNLGGLSLQPWGEISSYGFAAGFWGSVGSMPYATDGFKAGNYELDLYVSYTTPLDIFTIKATHFYYFDGSPYFSYANDGSSSTQTEIEGTFRWEGLSVGVATQVGGGDCYSLYNAYHSDATHNGDPLHKMWSTYLYIIYDWAITDNWNWKNEVGMSPNKSSYTYFNYNEATGDVTHANYAFNNISSTVTYNHCFKDFVNVYFLAGVTFNLFDVSYDKFKYGKNFEWNVGVGIVL